MKNFAIRVDLRIALLYAFFGGLWILLSDYLLQAYVSDVATLTTYQTYKGWAFVLYSTLLIFFLLRRALSLNQIAQDKLQETEEQYRLLFENSIDAILLSTPDGNIYTANPAACRMFERTEEEIKQLGRSGIMDVTDPRVQAALKERDRSGRFQGELTFLRKDGTKFQGEITTNLIENTNGLKLTSITIRDITERGQATASLRESERRFSTIFHASPAAIALSRLDNHQFVDVNAAWQAMTGYSHAEAIGHTSFDLNLWIDPEQRPGLIDTLRAQGAARAEVQIRQKSGKISDVLISAELIELAGIQCLLTMAQDITARKQAEAQLAEQLNELRRWHAVTLGREGRVIELKREVNELLAQAGQPPRYPSAEMENA